MRVDAQWLKTQKADRLAACRLLSESRIALVRSRLLPRLKTAFSLQALWLFGSTARRTASADSDVDLLLVCEETEERWIDRQARSARACEDVDLPFSCDVIVWTVQEWQRAQMNGNGLGAAVLAEGERVYER